MAETFRCPSCSAPMEFEGKTMQKCRFCGSSVIVPASVMQSSAAFGGAGRLDFGDFSNLTGKAMKIAEIQQSLQAGNKINAIKIFRETFGVSLAEAKAAVERLERGESLDVSGMQIHAQPARRHVQLNAQNLDAVKKIGYTVGGSILLTIVVTMVLIVGAIVGVFYFVSSAVNKAVEKPFVSDANPSPPGGKSVKTAPAEASIAEEVLKFGGEGTGAGKFKDNRTIAVDREGRIYAADYSGGRIQVFDPAGAFQTQILADTTRTVDALGVDLKAANLYVLQGYDVYRVQLGTGESAGKTRVETATDLAVGLDGKVYVSNRRGEIVVLGADGAKLKTIVVARELNLDYIDQLAVDGTGNFFLLDARSSAVFKLSPEGKLLTRFGGLANSSDENQPKALFNNQPEDMTLDSQGRLYVSQNVRIGVYDSNGNFLNDFKTRQAFGLALNDKDELLVAARPYVVKYKLNF